ncbi:MAG: hypothetical protein ACOY82_08010 [Pseudomonadota bacterium]
MTTPALLFRSLSRLACVALATIVACSASAQDATSPADNPKAQQVADIFAERCGKEMVESVPQWTRDDAGKNASPALIEHMVAVTREGLCECFVGVMRRQPDDRIGPTTMDDLKPQFEACMAAAMKPRMERICTESQRMPKDDSAPDCACLATAVATIDDMALGAGANDLFRVLNSTRDIPTSAGALGEAARGCANTSAH